LIHGQSQPLVAIPERRCIVRFALASTAILAKAGTPRFGLAEMAAG